MVQFGNFTSMKIQPKTMFETSFGFRLKMPCCRLSYISFESISLTCKAWTFSNPKDGLFAIFCARSLFYTHTHQPYNRITLLHTRSACIFSRSSTLALTTNLRAERLARDSPLYDSKISTTKACQIEINKCVTQTTFILVSFTIVTVCVACVPH